jgi:integrase
MDIKVLSEILGHSSVSVTLNYYVHPDLAYKRRQINKFANAY